MKHFILPQRFLFRCFTLGVLGLTANELIAQEVYKFHCQDYVSTDDNRAPQSVFSYDETGNTFTINASGNMNIAFQMSSSKDGAYYINNQQEWFLVEGSDLKLDKSQSNIWWFNGINSYPGSEPDHTITNTDGNTILLWNIKNNSDLNKGMDFSSPTILLTAKGAEFFQAMGMTAGSSGKSTIKNIAYYAPYEAAATYPVLISTLNYTEESLTTEIKNKLESRIADAEALCDKAQESESKTKLTDAINQSKTILGEAGTNDYATVFESLNKLNQAIEDFKQSVYAYGYEKTANGIHATLNDMHIHVMLYGNDVVRVYKSHEEEINKESLSVIQKPEGNVAFDVTDDGNIVTVSTDKVKVLYHLMTGQVEVQKADATPLIKEKEHSTTFLPYKDNAYDKYQIMHTFQLDTDEAIYGLGQIQNGLLNQRGQNIYLHQENMKVCIPYFQSSKNYALFWDNYSPTTFTDNDEGTSFQSTGTAVDYYVLCGENSDDVLKQMRELTGKSPMPALWNFGLYQSKERYTSAEETTNVVKEYRRLGVPLDCVVQDWQYWGDDYHWNALEFLNPTFANHEKMIETIHDNNAKLMISIWANFGPETKPFKDLEAQGRLIPVETYPSGKGVHPYDVYGEKARDTYWSYLYNGLVSKGIDAYWMDSSEPDYYQTTANDFDYITEDGKTWRSVRNAFPLAHVGGVYDHHRAAEKANDPYLAGKRVAILTRSAFAGQQRYGANTWSGDVVSNWSNLAKQIPAACNLSACGIPYWNSDIGGFFTWEYPNGVNDAAWRQLYLRWMQFGTFTPMMRFHGTGTPREIYQFGSANDGKGDFDQILKYVKIRYRMLPYLYSTAWQVSQYDKTFMQALPIAFNEDPNGYEINDEYMFGESFLVAPVVTEGNSQRSVYLPAGHKWINFWNGETLEGGQSIVNKGHSDEIPLFVKAGSILPWGPDVQYSTEKNWDNLEIRVYPGENGSFTLYEDENNNYNYENGKYTEIPFTWDEATQSLTIGARKGNFDGMLETRTFNICKVSTRMGKGDAHETRYHATVEYTGEEITVSLKDTEEPVSQKELTDLIQNPSFEEDGTTFQGKAPKGWTTNCNTEWWGVNRGGGTGDPAATDGEYIFGVWSSTNDRNGEISQTITLPAGHYELTVDMQATNQGEKMRVGNQRLFANDATALFKDQVMTYGSTDNEPLQTIRLEFDVENDNTPVKIGVTTDGAKDQTWYKIDNFRLYSVTRPVKTLDENNDFDVETNLLTDVELLRSFKADGYWNTLCIPFDMTAEQATACFTDVKKLNDVEAKEEGITLNFTDASGIEAGIPYLVKVNTATTELTFRDMLVKASQPSPLTVDDVNMQGVYSPVTINNNEFFINDNAFYRANQDVSVKGYRAYITLNGQDTQEVNRLLINIDGNPTSVETIADAQSIVDVCNLSGMTLKSKVNITHALDGLPKGIYIVNGKKIIKK